MPQLPSLCVHISLSPLRCCFAPLPLGGVRVICYALSLEGSVSQEAVFAFGASCLPPTTGMCLGLVVRYPLHHNPDSLGTYVVENL